MTVIVALPHNVKPSRNLTKYLFDVKGFIKFVKDYQQFSLFCLNRSVCLSEPKKGWDFILLNFTANHQTNEIRS